MQVDRKTMEELLHPEDEHHINQHMDPDPTRNLVLTAVIGTLFLSIVIILVSLGGIGLVLGGVLALMISAVTDLQLDKVFPYTFGVVVVITAVYFFFLRRT